MINMKFKCLIDILEEKEYIENFSDTTNDDWNECPIFLIETKYKDVFDKITEVLNKTCNLIIYCAYLSTNKIYRVQYMRLEDIIDVQREIRYTSAPPFWYQYNNLIKIANALKDEYRFEKVDKYNYKIIDLEKERKEREKAEAKARKEQEVRDFINSLP